MSAIKGSELPPSLAHAFIDCLEAWGDLEHELFMVWQFLQGAIDYSVAWEKFSRMGTSEQRKATIKLVRRSLDGRSGTTALPDVFDQLKELTALRDRIVHGRWKRITVLDERSRPLNDEFLRVYDARGENARPRNEVDERPMLGRSRFYEGDLRELEKRFRTAARDLRFALADLM